MKRVLVVGGAGQDGTLLAQLLRARSVDYLCLNRQGTVHPDGRPDCTGLLTDSKFVAKVIRAYAPTQVYYLAAHHHSSEDAGVDDTSLWRESLNVQVVGLVNILEALRLEGGAAKLFYASSSHIFGSMAEAPQTEISPRAPDNVYGITKITGMEACRYYRQHHRLFASVGIFYNHESVYRKEKFLSQKIIRAALAIKKGRSKQLVLGDLSSEVDWGYAPDYVEAIVRILDLPQPDDFIIATGEAHSVREFVQLAFEQVGLDYREWVTEDASIIRRRHGSLIGDSSKLRRATGWLPSVTFSDMVARLTSETSRFYPDLSE